MWEMKRAIKGRKTTAPGRSGVPASVWKGLWKNKITEETMLQVMVGSWEAEKVPEEWTEFHMCMLPKKGDLKNVTNWRGISMAETLSKVYSAIIKKDWSSNTTQLHHDTVTALGGDAAGPAADML
jgi:hypothetical protein